MKSKKVSMLFVLSLAAMGIASCANDTPASSSETTSEPENSQSQVSSPDTQAPSSNPTSDSSTSEEPAPSSESSTYEDASSSEEPASSSSESSSESSSSEEDPDLVDGYRRIESIEELASASKVIIGAYNKADLFGMTATPKREDLPWYITGEALKEANDHKDVATISNTAIWDVTKLGESTFKFTVDGKDLHRYISGTHYSIGVEAGKEGTDWTITFDEEGKAQALSSKNVYLQYYSSSFCGTSEAHKDNAYVYFYVPGKISVPTPDTPDVPKIDDSDLNYGGTTDSTHWEGLNFNTYGNSFRGALKQLIASRYKTNSVTYSECKEIGMSAASYPEGSDTFVPFYHAAPNVSEGVTGKGAYTVNRNGNESINREHTWPNSRGCGETGPGCDPFIIRPTLEAENSGRGNNFYGTESATWDPASCGYEAARGESARIMFYAATAYYGTCGEGGSSKGNEPLELSNNPSDATTAHTMGTLKELLKWNAKYPVTAMEKQINEYLAAHGYGRNPFVDHPEYANQIWDFDGIRTKTFDGTDIPDVDEPSIDIPELTPNGENAEVLNVSIFQFTKVTEPEGFSIGGGAIQVKMKKGASACHYNKSDKTILVYPNGGMEFTASEGNIASVEFEYKAVPSSSGKTISGLTYSCWGKDTELEVKDNETVKVSMPVNGKTFSFKAVGEGGYLAFSSILLNLAD